jgi:hypothetical protein
LAGKLRTIAIGGGTQWRTAFFSSARKSIPGPTGMWRIEAPAMMKPKAWIG